MILPVHTNILFGKNLPRPSGKARDPQTKFWYWPANPGRHRPFLLRAVKIRPGDAGRQEIFEIFLLRLVHNLSPNTANNAFEYC
jgi:hypothetical protein